MCKQELLGERACSFPEAIRTIEIIMSQTKNKSRPPRPGACGEPRKVATLGHKIEARPSAENTCWIGMVCWPCHKSPVIGPWARIPAKELFKVQMNFILI